MPRSNSANTQVPVSNVPLTALEMQVASEFVTAAAGTYGDHSCNEFDLPDTPTRRALVQAVIDGLDKRADDDPYPLHAHDGVIYFYDYVLMGFLGRRWEALAERAASGPIASPLCREELETMASVLEMLASNGYKEYAHDGEAPDYALPLTPEGQQLAEAVMQYVSGGAGKRIKAAEFGYDIHAVQCLKYLATRCQELAAVSPDEGLAFTGVDAAIPRRAGASLQPGAASTIPGLTRSGVGPNWLKVWKKDVAGRKMQVEEWGNGLEVDAFNRYANEGKETDAPPPSVSPPFRNWECGLHRRLSAFIAMRTCLVEAEAFTSNAFPTTKWRSLFAATYLYSFSEFRRLSLWSLRFPDVERFGDSPYRLVYYAAIGMVMGFREHALRLVRLHLLAHRLELFDYPQYYPAAQSLLRIFAGYLGEPEITLKGEALTHPAYSALAKHWRHPEAELLVPVLLAVCDEHTRRSVRGKPYGDQCDFEYFARTPVEILLVLKLREELGLPNPKLDHPLMNTPLGVLPKEIPFEFDELLAPVVKRMREDGFDEEAILADFVAAVNEK